MNETQNAVITSTMLGKEGHGIPSFMIRMDLQNNNSQGFGGYDLRHPNHHVAVFEILDAVDVKRWEELVGTNVRIKGSFNKIDAIGHIVKDQWYTPNTETSS